MRRGFCLIPPVTSPKTALAGIETVFASRNPWGSGDSAARDRRFAKERSLHCIRAALGLWFAASRARSSSRGPRSRKAYAQVSARGREPQAKAELTNGLNICRTISASLGGSLSRGAGGFSSSGRHSQRALDTIRSKIASREGSALNPCVTLDGFNHERRRREHGSNREVAISDRCRSTDIFASRRTAFGRALVCRSRAPKA